ncbi:MAG: cupin domain-containing protein [Acidobacteriota bacterium]
MIKNIGNAEHYQWGQVCEGWRLLDRADLSVIQEHVPPGAGEVRHRHTRARQLFVVLSGQLTIETTDALFRLAAGDALEVPPTEPHVARNDSRADVSFLVISAPSTKNDRDDLG